MQKEFTEADGLAVQARHLEEWAAILNDRAYAELSRLVAAENAELPPDGDGYAVRRGCGLAELVHNEIARSLSTPGPRARIVPESLAVLSADVDPSGVRWLTVGVPNGWDDVRPLTGRVLSFEGREYGFTGWNSDRNVAYFRTGAPVARAC